MSETSIPVEVFCSYAREDETWLRKLETYLSLLERQGLITLWHDRLIVPGTNWAKAIDAHLETASVILLLVSADFFASDYCVGVVMQRALQRQDEGSACVIPILVREIHWTDTPFAHLQALPTDAKPLATWPDEERALADVAAGIRRAIEELPLLAASAPRAALPAIWNIPYPRNPYFLGRDDDLAQLRSHLQAGQATALSQPQAISGLGGIGKTQLALEYAYRYHQDYQAVLWARTESTEALVSSYVAIASLLRLPEREAKEQDLAVQAVKTWLQTHRSWLLILDNADELALLADFLPPALGGHLLLTTRAAATGRLAHRLEIETLLPEHATLFLLRRAALLAPDATLNQASQEERELAVRISQELGRLPLALDQAGAYLEETGMALAEYWRIYQQHRAELLRERRGLVADHPEPVATTWSLSFQRVEEKNPAAAELLRLCAFLSPDAIPEEILTAGALSLGPVLALVAADAFQLNQAIEALRSYSLMRRDPKGKTLSIHRLVQAVFQDTLEDADRKRWTERAVLAVNATFPDVEQAVWSQCERLLPQALATVGLIEREQISDQEAVRLLDQTAAYLYDRARYQDAEPLYLLILRIEEQMSRAGYRQVSAWITKLGILHYLQGKYEQAESLYLRALQIRERAEGVNHVNIAHLLHNLGDLYYQQGKYEQAEPLYLRALYIWESALDTAHPVLAFPLNGLANIYRDQGKYEQAEPLYLRALQIREKELGSDHPYVATSLNGLANLYLEQSKHAEAEPLYRRALSIQEHHLGLQHPEVAETMHDFARLREAQGNNEEANNWYTRALTVREQALGARHPKTTETRMRLIALIHAPGQHKKPAQLETAQAEQGTSEEELKTHPEE
jgi:tetratricopeptide (TPR) repeat protein